MSLATEKEFKNIHEFIERRLGGRKPASDEELNELIQEYMDQTNTMLEAQEPLTEETAEDVFDWLELAGRARSKKVQRRYLEKAKELEPKNLDVLSALLFLDKRAYHEYLPDVERLLALGKEDLRERKIYQQSVGDFYQVLETRPYIRLMHMYMFLLQQCMMLRKAIAVGKEILKLNCSDNLGVRYTLMHLYVYMEDEYNALKLMRQFKEVDDTAGFQLPLALLYFQEGKSEEAKGVLKRLSTTYRGFRSFLKDAAELRLLDESEYIDEYQLYTESELVSCYQENLFLWDSRQEFFQWARKAMTPPRKKKGQTTT